jgi:hypothetical protein
VTTNVSGGTSAFNSGGCYMDTSGTGGSSTAKELNLYDAGAANAKTVLRIRSNMFRSNLWHTRLFKITSTVAISCPPLNRR